MKRLAKVRLVAALTLGAGTASAAGTPSVTSQCGFIFNSQYWWLPICATNFTPGHATLLATAWDSGGGYWSGSGTFDSSGSTGWIVPAQASYWSKCSTVFSNVSGWEGNVRGNQMDYLVLDSTTFASVASGTQYMACPAVSLTNNGPMFWQATPNGVAYFRPPASNAPNPSAPINISYGLGQPRESITVTLPFLPSGDTVKVSTFNAPTNPNLVFVKSGTVGADGTFSIDLVTYCASTTTRLGDVDIVVQDTTRNFTAAASIPSASGRAIRQPAGSDRPTPKAAQVFLDLSELLASRTARGAQCVPEPDYAA